jgi:hypothetical protein
MAEMLPYLDSIDDLPDDAPEGQLVFFEDDPFVVFFWGGKWWRSLGSTCPTCGHAEQAFQAVR